ncbi:MAG: protein translocase subunit SecF, partial [Clostridia bacterium]
MINIIGMKKIFFIISSIIILIGLSTMLISGLNEDIDFAGGTAMHINIGRTFDNDEIADSVSEAIQVEPSSVQKVGDGTEVIIKTKVIDTIQRDKVFQVLKEKYELKQEDLFSTDNVDPTIGKELRSQAFLASIIASVLMLLYITFRFEFKSGIAAVIGLLHDVLIMLTVYAVFRVPVNTSFIAAILTILGYSINDTIIVFDRIRENRKLMKKESITAVVNKSIFQTMS